MRTRAGAERALAGAGWAGPGGGPEYIRRRRLHPPPHTPQVSRDHVLGRLAEASRAGVAGGVGRAMELEEAARCATPFTSAEFKGTSHGFAWAPGLSGGTESV